jgi:hypothetical protein
MESLSQLEEAVMKRLLDGSDPVLQTLAAQLRMARIKDRELTGVGFYTAFDVPPEAPRLEANNTFSFGDVRAELEGLSHGAGFVLHVTDGVLDCLEGYSYDEPWPLESERFVLSYVPGPDRDIEALRRKFGD